MNLFGAFLVVAAVAALASGNPVPNATRSARRLQNLHQDPFMLGIDENASFNGRLIQSHTIDQKVDQFSDTNTDTWPMRYYSNSAYYVPGGPLFIYVGGEWTISYSSITGGHTHDMAKEMNGYLFYTEHRYYGQSRPTSDASSANLQYLNVDQALADLAHFIDVQRATIPGAKYSGVILVGGSYSATMVAWFRQRYPDKVNGAWASSAPLLAKLDYFEYKEAMSTAILKAGGEECSARIETAFANVEALIANGQVAEVTEKFNLCQDIDTSNDLDVWNFFSIISDEFAGLVQYHSPGDIESTCQYLTNSAFTDPVEAVGNWIKAQFSREPCVQASYASFVELYEIDQWNTASTSNAMRQWIYQTCNEFGWFQTSTSEDQIFGSSFPAQLNVELCLALYSNQFSSTFIQGRIDATNANHNGMNIDVTNVFFTHGEHDPWRPMGVQTDVNAASPVVIINDYAHCKDLGSISASDSAQMRETKLRVTASVRQWLGM